MGAADVALKLHDFFHGELPRALTHATRLCGSFTHKPPILHKSPSMQRLPNELLVYIFLFATHCYDLSEAILSPIVVSQVCSRWRQVALSTGNLWTNLILTFPTSPGKLSRTLTWLSRSKTYPLDILLDFRDSSWDWQENSHTFRWKDMEAVVRLLLPHVIRWQRFELLTDTWAPIFTFLWYTRRVESAPMLRSIALSRCNAYFAAKGQGFEPAALKQPVPLFGGIALDNLREVSFAGVHVDWSKSALRNLVALEFKYHARDVMPSLNEFIDILSACPDLKRLTILGWGPRLDLPLNNATPGTENEEGPFDLTRLQRSIQLPHLTRFSFGFLDIEYAIELLSLFCLPALEELAFEDVSTTLNLTEPQDATPILEWLASNRSSRCPSPSHTSACCAIISYPLNRVNTLELHGVRSSETTFSHFLREFASLRRLSLFDTESDVLQALKPRHFPMIFVHGSDRLDTPCPALTELNCRNVDSVILVGVVTARAEVDSVSQLEQVCLDVPDSDDRYISDVDRMTLIKAGIRLLIAPRDGAQDGLLEAGVLTRHVLRL